MGCSASRLSRTRSGTVSSRFLTAGIACLSLPAPVPPLALIGGKKRVARLGHGSRENILAADIHALAGNAAQFLIEAGRVLAGKLFHAADAEQFKIAQHGGTNGDQIF